MFYLEITCQSGRVYLSEGLPLGEVIYSAVPRGLHQSYGLGLAERDRYMMQTEPVDCYLVVFLCRRFNNSSITHSKLFDGGTCDCVGSGIFNG